MENKHGMLKIIKIKENSNDNGEHMAVFKKSQEQNGNIWTTD